MSFVRLVLFLMICPGLVLLMIPVLAGVGAIIQSVMDVANTTAKVIVAIPALFTAGLLFCLVVVILVGAVKSIFCIGRK